VTQIKVRGVSALNLKLRGVCGLLSGAKKSRYYLNLP
jgi:hypothetical protein